MQQFTEEIWKDVVGFEGLYQVSNLGRVKSLDRVLSIKTSNQVVSFSCLRTKKGKVLKPVNRGRGYLCVSLSDRDRCRLVNIHLIVAEAFLEKPRPDKVINHKDGNKANNTLENLEWVSTSENHLHAVNFLGQLRGDTHGMSKLTEDQAKQIKSLRKLGYSAKILSEMFNIGESQVKRISSGKSWKYLED